MKHPIVDNPVALLPCADWRFAHWNLTHRAWVLRCSFSESGERGRSSRFSYLPESSVAKSAN